MWRKPGEEFQSNCSKGTLGAHRVVCLPSATVPSYACLFTLAFLGEYGLVTEQYDYVWVVWSCGIVYSHLSAQSSGSFPQYDQYADLANWLVFGA